jgi:hypothetical protein
LEVLLIRLNTSHLNTHQSLCLDNLVIIYAGISSLLALVPSIPEAISIQKATESQVLKNSDQEVTENEKQINTPGPQIPGILHMSLFHILFSPSTPDPTC